MSIGQLGQLPDRANFTKDFPVLGKTINGRSPVYLDSAATSLTPRPVIDAVARYGLDLCGAVHRGQHQWSDATTEAYETARREVANFLCAAPDEVVFVRNATEAINVVAQGLPWAEDDEIVIGHDAHHSNALPWRVAARTVVVPLDRHGLWDLNRYEDILKRRPKLVALTHVSNVTGIYQPLQQLIAMAKAVDALVLVDACQAIPHEQLKVQELNMDILAFSAHKMLGPTGIGVLYVRRQLMRTMTPRYIGGGSVEWVDRTNFRRRAGPRAYEAGTPNVGGVLGLAAALKYLDGLGWSAVSAHNDEMSDVIYGEARKRASYLNIIYPDTPARRAGLVSFSFAGNLRADDVARMLSDSFGIMCRAGHLCAQPLVDEFKASGVLRASAYVYNEPRDIRQLFETLDEIAVRLAHPPFRRRV
ncbi:aminotransferase class V-fold PLP-dependent enzyme [Rhizobium laguerreae]|uniref:aminotransferase class V-fold PLP-dependent enzyme n=1 Tax=Rhizobium laguerreae TaxID=1076926 RepID=UPI001C92A298|nr:cysteine desulfurase [Rhizobium laguerreae]MBY3203464.1 cysteine desulfurase [Rhizobium laguerreae]